MGNLVFEIGLAIALMAAATILAGRLKLSVVPFLILIGLAVGPHAPHFGPIDFRFIQSKELIDFMGRMGVLFLLFYLGLEFSLGRLIRAGGSVAVASVIYIAINLSLGLLFGGAIGLPGREILVIAGITTISSSAIVARVIVDLKRSARAETQLILGIIMGEDIFLAVYIALVSGLVLFGTTTASRVAISMVIAVAFVALLFVLGRYFSRYLDRWFGRLSEESLMLVAFAGLFLIAGLAETLGLAEAIGALMMGLVLGETSHTRHFQRVSIPFRDFFGAFLFFSFGLSIDPLTLGGAAGFAVAAAALTVAGNLLAGIVVGLLAKLPAPAGVSIGLTIVSRGEFSIVMASLARLGGLSPFLQPFTALYVLILSVLGPVLTKESDRLYGLGGALARGLGARFPVRGRPRPDRGTDDQSAQTAPADPEERDGES